MVYCRRAWGDAEQFEGAGLGRGELWIEQEVVLGSAGGSHRVAGEGAEFAEQSAEAVHRQPVIGVLAGGLAAGRLGALRWGDDGRAGSGGFAALVIVEQDRGEPLAQVPLEVIGEHAEQDMGADVIGQAMMDRADLGSDFSQIGLGGGQ